MGTWVILGDPDAGAGYVSQVRAVTAQELRAAARELFRSSRATFGIVRPRASRVAIAPVPAVDWKAILRGLDEAAPGAALIEHASGARIIIDESRRNRVVALDMKVAGGQLAEPTGEGGVAQLTERLLARGTKRLDRAAFARELDRLAVRISTASGSESTTLSIRATDETFEPAIALLGEMIHEPAFAEDEVKSAREETLEAIASIEDDSFALTQQAFADALYGPQHPYGRPLLGTKESVSTLGREAVVRFHARTFRPESMVIAVAGAIDRGRAMALIEKHLIGDAAPAAPKRYVVPAAPPARARTILLDRKREQATLDLGLPVVSIGENDYLPLQVALRHLGTELFFMYVYEQGKAYRMWTYLRPGTGTRPLVLETGVAAPSFPGVKEGLLAAVRSLVENGLTQDDLAKAKKDFLNGILLARETSEDRARSLSAFELQGVGYDWEDRLPRLLDAVTVESVKDALRRRIDPSKLTLVVVGDRAALEAQGASFPQPDRPEPD
jgi:zinc protease